MPSPFVYACPGDGPPEAVWDSLRRGADGG